MHNANPCNRHTSYNRNSRPNRTGSNRCEPRRTTGNSGDRYAVKLTMPALVLLIAAVFAFRACAPAAAKASEPQTAVSAPATLSDGLYHGQAPETLPEPESPADGETDGYNALWLDDPAAAATAAVVYEPQP